MKEKSFLFIGVASILLASNIWVAGCTGQSIALEGTTASEMAEEVTIEETAIVSEAMTETITEGATLPAVEIELNSLQYLFTLISKESTIQDFDYYINGSDLKCHKFTGNSGYNIGYTNTSISTRSRDREGETIDVSFETGQTNNLERTVKHAEYYLDYGNKLLGKIEYANGVFTCLGQRFTDGYEAMQMYLGNH